MAENYLECNLLKVNRTTNQFISLLSAMTGFVNEYKRIRVYIGQLNHSKLMCGLSRYNTFYKLYKFSTLNMSHITCARTSSIKTVTHMDSALIMQQ